MGRSFNNMRNIAVYFFGIVLLGGMMLGLAGCDPEMEANPILPGQVAYLEVTFSPNPIIEGYNDRTLVTLSIEEKNGVGGWIRSIKFEYMDDDGYVVETENWNEYEVQQAFGTSRFESFGYPLRTQLRIDDCYFCDKLNCLVRIADDQGNYPEYSGNLVIVTR